MAGKGHHAGTQAQVQVVQRGRLERGFGHGGFLQGHRRLRRMLAQGALAVRFT
jgi:hypothetical protein